MTTDTPPGKPAGTRTKKAATRKAGASGSTERGDTKKLSDLQERVERLEAATGLDQHRPN